MQHNNPTRFVRGGQSTQHWVRMAKQVFNYSAIVSAFVYTLALIVLFFMYFETNKVKLAYWYRLATFAIETRGDETRLYQFENIDGQLVQQTSLEMYLRADLKALKEEYDRRTVLVLWLAGIPALISFFGTAIVFHRVGQNLGEEDHIRGAILVTAQELKRWSQSKWKGYEAKFGRRSKTAPRYTIAGIPFPPNAVEAQIGITGTVGVGKTNAMHELLNTIRSVDGRAIIYDRTGALVRDHYDPSKDIILNPFDQRTVGWSPFMDANDAASFAMIAEVMIPDREGSNDAFWSQSARLVFEYAARQLSKNANTRTNKDLRRAILQIPATELAALLAGTPAAHFFGDDIAKTSASVRANLIAELRFLEFLRDDCEAFSVRDWVKKEDTKDGGFLFLTGDAEHAAATRNVISAAFEVAANAMMSGEESRDPKLWFFMDELPTLNRLPFLAKSLAEIRQYGGAFVLGYQVFSQLEDIYGLKTAETISGVLNNRIVFNTPDFNTAERSSKSLGEEDVVEMNENLTLGANETRDGVGIMGRRTQRRIVTPGEIQSLPQFKAYFRPAYDAPTALVTFEPVQTEASQPKFIPYTGPSFGNGDMEREALYQHLREGNLPTSGFGAKPIRDQHAAFQAWYQHQEAQEGIALSDTAFEIDWPKTSWYWEYFADWCQRGRAANACPIPVQGFDPSLEKNPLIRLPYPGFNPRLSCHPEAIVPAGSRARVHGLGDVMGQADGTVVMPPKSQNAVPIAPAKDRNTAAAQADRDVYAPKQMALPLSGLPNAAITDEQTADSEATEYIDGDGVVHEVQARGLKATVTPTNRFVVNISKINGDML